MDAEADIVNLKTDGLINPVGLDDAAPRFSWQMKSDVTGAAQFGDAQWIGADELQLDAASIVVFNISSRVTIPEGSDSASYIIGADDFRLENENFNINRTATDENYVRLELDISEVNENGGAKINAYRVGHADGDSADEPMVVIENNDTLNGLITSANAHEEHELGFKVCAGRITAVIDGTEFSKNNEVIVVNDLVGDSSYNSYPNLSSVGFYAKEGQSATFSDYKIENGGDYGRGVLFAENTGATYSVFEGLNGISISGNVITVSGGYGYADTTYAVAHMLRKEFSAEGNVANARLYLSAQGIYNVYINGKELASDEWFNPGCAEYDAYMPYNTYDVTEYIKSSNENAIGAVLGEGWWTGQMTYEATNELANQLFNNITNSTTSNYISIHTDCPQRNERMGWTGDAQVFALTGSYVADTYGLLDTWMKSVKADSGKDTRLSPQYIPAFVSYNTDDESIEHTGQSFGITWNALAVTIPYNLYVQTGRRDIIEKNIDNIITYVDHLIDTPFSYKDADDNKIEETILTAFGVMLEYFFTRERITEESMGEEEKKESIPMKTHVNACMHDKFFLVYFSIGYFR